MIELADLLSNVIRNKLLRSMRTISMILFLQILLFAIGGWQNVLLAQGVPLPSCTSDITVTDDNDGVSQILDIDKDGDGLIEICDLEGLNEIRFQLDGTGYKANAGASKVTTGCPSTGCKGYELTRSLDFESDADYRNTTTAWTVLSFTDTTDTGWAPIGNVTNNFRSIFNGNGHTIRNLQINRDDSDHMGLFAVLSAGAIVNNLGLLEVEIEGNGNVGSLVGSNQGAVINSYAIGKVSGSSPRTGGLSGLNNGKIINSYAIVEVRGTNQIVGGLVGEHSGASGEIENSYAMGPVSAGGGIPSRLGGLIGYRENSATVKNSYSIGAVAVRGSRSTIGGLIGRNDDGDANIIASYWDTDTSGQENSNGGTGKTKSELQSGIAQSSTANGVYYEWSNSNWNFGTSSQYPAVKYAKGSDTSNPACSDNSPDNTAGLPQCNTVLSGQGVPLPSCTSDIKVTDDNDGVSQTSDIDKDGDGLIEICDLEGLNEIRFQLDGTGYKANAGATKVTTGCPSTGCKGYELTRSLDFNNPSHYRNSANSAKWTASKGWEPILVPVLGTLTFEGNNHTISNLYINRPGALIALFYQISQSSEIRNINLSDVNVSGAYYVGGLIGLNAGKISNSHITGTVLASNVNVGGLAGMNGSTGSITDSSANGTITGKETVGGLVGHNNEGKISSSFAEGVITGNKHVGGLVGVNRVSGSIIDSYADSTVNGTEDTDENIGGLIGINWGLVTASYATGDVTGTGNDSQNIGGLVGRNQSLIINSYATGEVQGHSDVGGLAGDNGSFSEHNVKTFGRIANSYATGNVIGTGNNSQNIGGLVGNNKEVITNAYAEGNVSGVSNLGGLVGSLEGGTVEKSYTIATVSSTRDDNQNIGGLVGVTSGTVTITASYWDNGVYSEGDTLPADEGSSRTTTALQSPITPGATSADVYYNWNTDSMGNLVYDWDFGSSQHYPILRYAADPDEDVAACDSDPDTALPQCNLLLPNQRNLDQGLDFVFFLSGNGYANVLGIHPIFSVNNTQTTVVLDTDEIQLRVFAINSTATIKITKDGETSEVNYFANKESGNISREISLNNMTTTLTITVTDTVNRIAVENAYSFTIERSTPLEISGFEVAPVNDDGTVDEGTEIILRPTVTGGRGNYQYEIQIDDKTITPLSQDTSAIKFEFDKNFVKAGASTRSAILKLIVKENIGNIPWRASHSRELVVKRIDNGPPLIEYRFLKGSSDFILSVEIDEADPDGNNVANTVKTKWRQLDYNNGNPQWTDIGLRSRTAGYVTYTVSIDTPKTTRYRVEVSYTDAQGYTHEEVNWFRFSDDDDKDRLIDIYYLEDLDAIRHQPDGEGYEGMKTEFESRCPYPGCLGYELKRNLDFDADTSYISTSNKVIWSHSENGKGWQPIETYSSIFEGNEHTISNLYINAPEESNLGLFKTIDSTAKIRNIDLVDVDINGASTIGSLVGVNRGAINSSHAAGNIEGTDSIGGLVGVNEGHILNSYTATGVDGAGVDIGGIVAINKGWITHSYAVGNAAGSDRVGGLVGHNNEGQITNSYVTGNVAGNKKSVMGSSVAFVGGLVGANNGFVFNSYTTGVVTESRDTQRNNEVIAGGLVGSHTAGAGEIIASYWQRGTDSTLPDIANVPLSFIAARTAEELKSNTVQGVALNDIYYEWSYDDWDFGNTMSYPILRYTAGPDGDACAVNTDAALPVCGTLLPGQINEADSKGLDSIFLLAKDSSEAEQILISYLVSDYAITVIGAEIIQLRPFAINGSSATIKITKEAESPEVNYFTGKESGTLSSEITLNAEAVTTITVVVTDNGADTVYEFAVSVVSLGDIPQLKITALTISPEDAIMDGVIDEGNSITLAIDVEGGVGNIREDVIQNHLYNWTYSVEYPPDTAGNTVLLMPEKETASLNVTVPANAIQPVSSNIKQNFIEGCGRDDCFVRTEGSIISYFVPTPPSSEVTFSVEVSDGYSAVTTKTTLTIKKIDNGPPQIKLSVNPERLAIAEINDPDGTRTLVSKNTEYIEDVRLNPNTVDVEWYRFQSCNARQMLGENDTIFLQPPLNPDLYSASITYTDDQGHRTTKVIGPFNVLIDEDGNQLIDINYLEDLEAMRYPLEDGGYSTNEINKRLCGTEGDEACEGYELIRSLDFNACDSYMSEHSRWKEEEGWEPIGNIENPFTGAFSASTENLVINNLFINRPATDYVGMFGVTNGEISGIHLENANINGRFIVGGIAGLTSLSSRISDSSVSGRVEGSDAWVGGLVGAHYGSINDSHAQGNVIGDTSVGGVAGYAFGPITNSYAHSDIRSQAYSGGLVGYSQGSISNSYASGGVESIFYAGGLVGYNDDGTIANAYAVGDVVGSTHVGGLVGYTRVGSIDYSYALGTISGADHIGELVGSNIGTTMTNSYTSEEIASNLGQSIWSSDNWEADGVDEPKLKYGGMSGDDASLRRDRYGYIVCDSEDTPMCSERLPDQNTAGGEVYALSALTLSAGTLEPPFDPTKSEYEIIDIGDSTETTVTATASTATVSISLGSQTVSGTPQASLIAQKTNLMNNNIVIELTVSGESTKKYTIMLPGQPDLTGTPSVPCDVANEDRDGDGLIEICDLEGLYAMRSQELPATCGGNDDESCIGYELEKDLDFGEDASYRNAMPNKELWSEGKGWYPIGTYANPFNAAFNANDHSIANLRIDRPNSDYVGLFGFVGEDATIADIGLVDAYVRGRFSVGGLVGQNNGGRIIGSYTSNETTTSLVIGSGLRVGGLVGDHKGIIGDNSYTSGIVLGNREVGGLVGYFGVNGDEAASGIVNSYARSAVRGRSFAGGLVGVNVNAIINSHATGAVESIFYAGGLVGLNVGSITNTYATGDVNGWEIVGGLAGDNRNSIDNSYARGTVTGHRSVGALVGNLSGDITHSFGIGHFKFIDRQFGGTIRNSRVVSSEQLQMPISEWDAGNAWYFEDQNYPALRYISVAADTSCEADALCETLLGGQYRELASLTVEEPADAELSKSAIFEYLLRIAEDVTEIKLIPEASNSDTVISYRIDNEPFNPATSGESFTIASLPATAQTITIKLEASDKDEGDLKDAEYIVFIERVSPTSIQLRLFLEGLLQE